MKYIISIPSFFLFNLSVQTWTMSMGNTKEQSNTFAFLSTVKISTCFFKMSTVANLPEIIFFQLKCLVLTTRLLGFFTSNDPNTHVNSF